MTISKITFSVLILAVALSACARKDGPAPVTEGSGQPVVLSNEVTVQKGDTVSGLAKRLGIDMQSLIAANNLTPPYTIRIGQRLKVPEGNGQTYVARRGDSVRSLAGVFGVSADELAQANGLRPRDRFTTGQTVNIPSGARVASASTSASVAPEVATAAPESVQVESLDATTPVASAASANTVVKSGTPLKGAVAVETLDVPQSAGPRPTTASASRFLQPPSPMPGENIAIDPPGPPGPASAFLWPVNGNVISNYGQKEDGTRNDGLNIAAPSGAPVLAASAGTVASVSQDMRGFGNLVLIQHDGGWVTVYAHVERILVEKGDHVTRGQSIATVGRTGGVSAPQLHFQIRKDGKIVDPRQYLGT